VTEIAITLTVNGEARRLHTEPCRTLLDVLRDDLGMLSVKEGCGQGDCGTCVVVMDGQAVNACLVLAAQADNAEIVTLEGLTDGGQLHPLQRRFAEEWAFQCGFCTAGMLMSAYALLLRQPDLSREEIVTALEGNLCRCTSYRAIIDAIEGAAADLAGKEAARD
jgi:carbon-monoxide dehydrogenase small subunit